MDKEKTPNSEQISDPIAVLLRDRLERFEINIDAEKYETVESAENIGEEKTPDQSQKFESNLKKLDASFAAGEKKLSNPNDSPFILGDKRLKLGDVNRIFRTILTEARYSPPIIQRIFVDHIEPSAANIRRLSEVLTQEKTRAPDPSNPFAVLDSSQRSKAIDTIKNELSKARVAHVWLLKNILKHPEKLKIPKPQGRQENGPVTLEPSELVTRLDSERFATAFTVEGRRMSESSKLQLCREVLGLIFRNNKDVPKEAINLLITKLIEPIIMQMRAVWRGNSTQAEKHAAIDTLDANLAEILHDILDEGDEAGGRLSGVKRYGKLIMSGIDDEHFPFDHTAIYLRTPEAVKIELGKARGKEERNQIKLRYYLEMVRREYKERLDELKIMYQERRLVSSEVFRESFGYQIGIEFDEIGDKPFQLIMAEVAVLLENAGFSVKERDTAVAVLCKDFFSNLQDLRIQRDGIIRNNDQDSNDVKLRGVGKRIDNLCVQFVAAVRDCLNDKDGDIRAVHSLTADVAGLLTLIPETPEDDSEQMSE